MDQSKQVDAQCLLITAGEGPSPYHEAETRDLSNDFLDKVKAHTCMRSHTARHTERERESKCELKRLSYRITKKKKRKVRRQPNGTTELLSRCTVSIFLDEKEESQKGKNPPKGVYLKHHN